MKITFFEVTENKTLNAYTEGLKDYEVNIFKGPIQDIDPSEYADSDIISVFINSEVESKYLDLIPNLKLVTTCSTGTDHIDLEYCENRGIEVKNVPFYGENTVAEHTVALMLAISRKIPKSIDRTKVENWDTTGLQGFDLKDKVLGIIGGGKIGTSVAKTAHALNMKILVYDRSQKAEAINFEYASLEELLKTSDIISLHIPLNDNTYHFIDEEKLNQMKDGVTIINTARGALINTGALISALESGKVHGCGLDVLEREKALIDLQDETTVTHSIPECVEALAESRALHKFNNVIITPHNAFNSVEASARIIETTLDNIKNFIKE